MGIVSKTKICLETPSMLGMCIHFVNCDYHESYLATRKDDRRVLYLNCDDMKMCATSKHKTMLRARD